MKKELMGSGLIKVENHWSRAQQKFLSHSTALTLTDSLLRWSPNEWPSVCREIPVSADSMFWTSNKPAQWTLYIYIMYVCNPVLIPKRDIITRPTETQYTSCIMLRGKTDRARTYPLALSAKAHASAVCTTRVQYGLLVQDPLASSCENGDELWAP
jgi:hypothetical protein